MSLSPCVHRVTAYIQERSSYIIAVKELYLFFSQVLLADVCFLLLEVTFPSEVC